MKSPQDMQFIQIDVTNACNLQCSNCTRFCGNHKKPFVMDMETFRRAVDSLVDFDGVTGIIGGEPTVHPQFEDMAKYIQSVHGKQTDIMKYPEKDFIHKMQQREFSAEQLMERVDGTHYLKKRGAGLWSNMSATYRKHYEIIQDTFSVQFLNDHLNASYHQPGLFSRRDLGIPYEEWIPLRDNCWMQNSWSATITPKGAFFCEVAGALDMLFNGPGGWKIEKNWWKRQPEDFKDQLHWCEICGFALKNIFSRDAKEEIDDASPSVYEKLKYLDSPKMKSGRINKVKIEDGKIAEESKAERPPFIFGVCYIENYEDRFQKENSVLFDIDYEECVVDDVENLCTFLAQKLRTESGEEIKTGKLGWMLLKDSDSVDVDEIKTLIGKTVFNPGILHRGDGYLLFSKQALCLRDIGFDGLKEMKSLDDLVKAWNPEKVIDTSDTEKMTDLCSDFVEEGKSYVIWGAGILGEYFAKTIRLSGGNVAFFVDKSEEKQGQDFGGIRICDPSEIVNRRDEYDALVIANHNHFESIRQEAVSLGIEESNIVMPLEMIESVGRRA